MKRLAFACLAAACLAGALPSQANQKVDAAQKRLAKLRKTLDNMTKAQSLAFRTSVQTTGTNMGIAVRIRGGGALGKKGKTPAVKASGVWVGDVLYHKCKNDNEVALHGRRRIATSGDGWEYVKDKLANGQPTPFLLDPEQFFRVLAHRQLQISKHSVGTFDNKPVEIYTLTFTDDEARKLGLAGLFPTSGTSSNIMAGGGVVVFGGAGGVRARPKGKAMVDIALFVEPGQGIIQHVKLRSYSTNPLAALMRGRVLRAGGGGDDEEEDEEETEEEDETGEPEFDKNGLPKRKVKDLMRTELDITFSKHNTAELPKLSARAKKLLGLNQ